VHRRENGGKENEKGQTGSRGGEGARAGHSYVKEEPFETMAVMQKALRLEGKTKEEGNACKESCVRRWDGRVGQNGFLHADSNVTH